MNILYIARHNQLSSNDDEGAIAHCLRKLGHTVELLHEDQARAGLARRRPDPDCVLFHKWRDLRAISQLPAPGVFWYFDLVEYRDPSLVNRNCDRRQWMNDVTPLVHTGFCSDGDWVDRDRSGKLVYLTQGADPRYVGQRTAPLRGRHEILFTGISQGGGGGRESFVAWLLETYGDRLLHVQRGVHQEELKTLIGQVPIVVAPDHPTTDRYWSNRVYLTLGFGGFLLHPHCEGLTQHYRNRDELVLYHSREDLRDQINRYLRMPQERERVARNGLNRTLLDHTYLNRCRSLIETLEQRGIGKKLVTF